jgi:hypothetical protein
LGLAYREREGAGDAGTVLYGVDGGSNAVPGDGMDEDKAGSLEVRLDNLLDMGERGILGLKKRIRGVLADRADAVRELGEGGVNLGHRIEKVNARLLYRERN